MNFTERLSLFVLAIISLAGMYYSTISYISGLNEAFASIAIFLMVFFTIFWILQFYRCIRIKIQRFFIKKISDPLAFQKKHPFLSIILELHAWFDFPKEEPKVEERKKLDSSSIENESREANSDLNLSKSIL